MDIEINGRSTHCYCENLCALGFRNYDNRDTMGFKTTHLRILFDDFDNKNKNSVFYFVTSGKIHFYLFIRN